MNNFDEAIKKKLLEDVNNFNNIIYNRTSVNESSINRMFYWINKCDCAFITAFRYKLTDIVNSDKTYYGPNNEWTEGKIFSHEENRMKNKLLYAELLKLKYGVIKVKGVYPEGMDKESSEESYLVVNRFNDPNFLNNILRLGEFHNQDSIYYKPQNKTYGYLIGTNDSYPGYHEKGDESTLKLGTASNYMSRLGNKAFSFIPKSAIKFNSKEDAVNTESDNQKYWTDYTGTSFKDRKKSRTINLNLQEALKFWRTNLGGINIIEDVHPKTRLSMYSFLKEHLNNG